MYKAKARSEKTGQCEFGGMLTGLVVTVRYIAPVRLREILKEATTDGITDPDRYLSIMSKELGVSWIGMTRTMLDSLVEFDGDGPTEVDGHVPFSSDLFAFLMVYAPADQFRTPLERVSSNILRVEAARKNGTGLGSGD